MITKWIAFFTRNSSKLVPTLLLALSLTGCASQKKAAFDPVFFPPAPNPPRIQYLTGISESTDIEEKKGGFSILAGKDSSSDKKTLYKPYGITSANGKIYVCDVGAGNVVIIDLAKKSFEYLKGNFNLGKLKKPANLALDKEGNMYVADALRKEIVVYNAQGEYVRAFGKEEEMKPSDVAVDGDNVYVLDIMQKKNEIRVFDRESGKLTGSLGKTTPEREVLAIPTNFTLDSEGFIYTTNAGSGKVIKLDRDDHVLMSFGEMGDIVGKFARPKGIAVDHEKRIFVVDGGHQNVQIFSDTGRTLAFFGDPGLPHGSLNLPVGITVTRDNLDYFQKLAAPGFELEAAILVTNQYGPEKISVYGLGQMKGAKKQTDAQLAEQVKQERQEKQEK